MAQYGSRKLALFLCLAAISSAPACRKGDTGPGSPSGSGVVAPASAVKGSSVAAPTPIARATASGANSNEKSAPSDALTAKSFAELFHSLSEPDREFFSDNYISNETSYLQVAPALVERTKPGGVYIGVGPEQSFTYIAHSSPRLAFIVDIRRQNALLHLLYKAIFSQARHRAHFLGLLFGRPGADIEAESPGGIAEVLEQVETHAPNTEYFERAHAELVATIGDGYAIPLSTKDRKSLRDVHEAFFRGQLDLRFSLKVANGRNYPSLRELLALRSPDDQRGSFLATQRDFKSLQRLQREHRIIPVVGDFAGSHALKAIGQEIERRGLTVSAFYVSNVEQYVMEPRQWKAYVANVQSLPTNETSLFIRCYLDQGRRHPLQLRGHRTATVLQPIHHFMKQQERSPYRSFYKLATDVAK